MSVKDKIFERVDERRDEIIGFVRDLVRTPSVNPPGDESKVAAILTEKMDEIGLEDVEVVEKERDRSNVLGWMHGSRGKPVLMYCGHTDVKPPGDLSLWRVPPFSAEIVDGVMHGRGTVDMKGGVGSMAMAAAVLKELGVELRGDLYLVLTAAEEAGAQLGIYYLAEKGYLHADAAIVGEPSGVEKSFDNMYLANRGNFLFDIVVHGTQVHSSMSDREGTINASVKLGNVLSRMADEFRLDCKPHPYYPQGATINLGDFIKGGAYYGMLPDFCVAGCDIRVPPGVTRGQVEEAVEACLNKLMREDPQIKAELRVQGFGQPAEISPSEPVVQASLEATEETLGSKPRIGGFPAFCDASLLINRMKIPTIPAYGPGLLSMTHAPNERIPIEDLIDATKIYALTAYKILK